MGRPQDHTKAKRKSHLSTHVVVVQGFVEPISVSEHYTAHLYYFLCYFYLFYQFIFQNILFLVVD